MKSKLHRAKQQMQPANIANTQVTTTTGRQSGNQLRIAQLESSIGRSALVKAQIALQKSANAPREPVVQKQTDEIQEESAPISGADDKGREDDELSETVLDTDLYSGASLVKFTLGNDQHSLSLRLTGSNEPEVGMSSSDWITIDEMHQTIVAHAATPLDAGYYAKYQRTSEDHRKVSRCI